MTVITKCLFALTSGAGLHCFVDYFRHLLDGEGKCDSLSFYHRVVLVFEALCIYCVLLVLLVLDLLPYFFFLFCLNLVVFSVWIILLFLDVLVLITLISAIFSCGHSCWLALFVWWFNFLYDLCLYLFSFLEPSYSVFVSLDYVLDYLLIMFWHYFFFAYLFLFVAGCF